MITNFAVHFGCHGNVCLTRDYHLGSPFQFNIASDDLGKGPNNIQLLQVLRSAPFQTLECIIVKSKYSNQSQLVELQYSQSVNVIDAKNLNNKNGY